MNPLVSEFVGTFILLLLGNGVNANVSLNKTYAQNSGWLVISLGWGIAVFVAVFVAGSSSGAHINPAVTLGLAMVGKFAWSSVPGYIAMQFLGAFCGAGLTYIHFRPHFTATDDPDTILGLFCTSPAIKNFKNNLVSEIIGTFALVFAVFFLVSGDGLGSLSALPVALLVVGIGLSLGGTTGYAINPARDFGPRLFHALAPIKGKRDSNWSYAVIPLLGPCVGALAAAGVYLLIF
ncbi:MAG: aquaporin family protein [Cyclobacteriaceae bacterium]